MPGRSGAKRRWAVVIERFAGVIALGLVLFWVFKDTEGTNAIVNSLGYSNRNFVGSLMGSPFGIYPSGGLKP